MECPHCHSREYIYSDYWRRSDRILYIFGFMPFSCRNCYQIFIKFRLLHSLQNWLGRKALRIRYVNEWQPSPRNLSEYLHEPASDESFSISSNPIAVQDMPSEAEPEPINYSINTIGFPPKALAQNDPKEEIRKRRAG
jgi:hypothetical protein